MGENSKIEWTDATFNPWVGCRSVSPACKNCYARAMVERFGGDFDARRLTSETNWCQPRKWNRDAERAGVRRRVFCASLADVFDDDAPEGARDRLWALIRETPALDWLLLTKRPENIARMLPPDWGEGYANVWLGTTVEDQQRANERSLYLLSVPARVRFLSMEPLLGPVDLTRIAAFPSPPWHAPLDGTPWLDVLRGEGRRPSDLTGVLIETYTESIDWVIVGGESGHGARPMHPDWARSIRDQCVAAGVAFHFKQWGEWGPGELLDPTNPHNAKRLDYVANRGGLMLDDPRLVVAPMTRLGKQSTGREIDGRTWDEFPKVTP